jgi:hypothetical protein
VLKLETKGCVTPVFTKSSINIVSPIAAMDVKVFPNPTSINFNLQFLTAGKEELTVSILDVQGRFIQSVLIKPNKTLNLGSDLKSGIYFVRFKRGNEVKTTRVVKL